MVIYKTTNLINGKIYIGQNSNNYEKYIGSGLLLTKAIKKYGFVNFKKEILEECSDKEHLNEREKYWIKFYDSTNCDIGYNISEGGTGGKLIPVEGKKGKTYEEYYGSERAKLIKAKLTHSLQNRVIGWKNNNGEKISESLKGKKVKEETKEKIKCSLVDYFNSEQGLEHRKKVSKLNKERIQSDESNKKRSTALKGKRPKKMDVHPSSQYWFFYDHENNLILETLGNRTQKLKELKTNQKKIIIFYNLDECLSYKLEPNKDYKLFTKKYYNNELET